MNGKSGRPLIIPGPIGKLALKVGSLKKLAEEIGVDVRTVRYWATEDRKPSGPSKKLLHQIASSHDINLSSGGNNDNKQ